MPGAWVAEFPRLWVLVFWCSGVLVILEATWVKAKVIEVPWRKRQGGCHAASLAG